MSIVSDVLMEALDNHDITTEEAAYIMRNYYSEGAVRDAVNNAARIMDASREDRASTIEQLKSNKGFKDAENNVKKYCAKAYKTMLKYSKTVAIKNDANGKSDMQDIINGINSAMTKYNSAKKLADKTDRSDITPVVKKIIANLQSAQKCFAADGTPNKEALKKLASNTRMEYGNLDAVDVDAKAPKPKSDEKDVKESYDVVLSESFFTDMKKKITDKHKAEGKVAPNGMPIEKPAPSKENPAGNIISKVMSIRTAANGAMGRKINALKKTKDYTSQDDIRDSDRSLNNYAGEVKDSIDKMGSLDNGKRYIPGLTKIMNYIKNAVSSKNPSDIETFRMNMMGQTVALVESYQMESVEEMFISEGIRLTSIDTSYKLDSVVTRFNYQAAEFRTHMSEGNRSAAKADIKKLQETVHTARNVINNAHDNMGIAETTVINILYDGMAIAGIAMGIMFASMPGGAVVGTAMASAYGGFGGFLTTKQIMNVIDDYKRTGKLNYGSSNAVLITYDAYLADLEKKFARMASELG